MIVLFYTKCNCPVVFYFVVLEKRERKKGKKNIYDLVYSEKKNFYLKFLKTHMPVLMDV